MKRLLIIAVAIAAPLCAQDAGSSLSAQQHDALQSYFACLYHEAAAADDGLVDAGSLARGFAPRCRPLLDAAVTVFTEGQSPADRDALNRKWLGLEEIQATRMVWAVREDHAYGLTPASDAPDAAPPRSPQPVQIASTRTTTPKPAAARFRPAAAAASDDGKPMSEWRRAYIARHGHEPPVAAK